MAVAFLKIMVMAFHIQELSLLNHFMFKVNSMSLRTMYQLFMARGLSCENVLYPQVGSQ